MTSRIAAIRKRAHQRGGYLSGTCMNIETMVAAFDDIPFLLKEHERLEAERDRWREDSMRQAATINRMAAAAEDRNEVDTHREKFHHEEVERLEAAVNGLAQAYADMDQTYRVRVSDLQVENAKLIAIEQKAWAVVLEAKSSLNERSTLHTWESICVLDELRTALCVRPHHRHLAPLSPSKRESEMTIHQLVDGTLYVRRDKEGKPLGIEGVCTCGWSTGMRFTSMAASAAFQDHCESIDRAYLIPTSEENP